MRNGFLGQGLAVSLALLLALVTAPVAAQPSEADRETAVAVVERLHDALLASMRAGSGDGAGMAAREALLRPTLVRVFDFPYISRLALSRHWRGADEVQRQSVIGLLESLSVASYARNFRSHDGERFETLKVEETGRGRLLVRTRLVQADGDEIPFDYVVQPSKGDPPWRIVNVIARGVSDLALKRSQYDAVIKADGIDALLAQLEQQVDDLEAKGDG